MTRNATALILAFFLVLVPTASASDYTEGIRIDPAMIERYRSRAQDYFEHDDFDKGIADLSAVIRLCPNDPQAYWDRAEAYREHGDPLFSLRRPSRHTRQLDFRRAIADYSEALLLKPADSAILLKRAELSLAIHDYDRAIADCSAALRLNPKEEQAYPIRLFAYCNKKDYDRAIADCTAYIRLNPSNHDRQGWYGQRAKIHEEKGDNQHARDDYTTLIRCRPHESSGYLLRGGFFLRTVAFHRALADSAEGIRLASEDKYGEFLLAELYSLRGRVFFKMGKLDEALVEFSRAIEQDDREGDPCLWRSLLHLHRGDCKLATADAAQAARRYKGRSHRQLLRSVLLLLLGEGRQAIADYLPQEEQFGMGSMGMGGMGGMGGMPSMPPKAEAPMPSAHPQRQ